MRGGVPPDQRGRTPQAPADGSHRRTPATSRFRRLPGAASQTQRMLGHHLARPSTKTPGGRVASQSNPTRSWALKSQGTGLRLPEPGPSARRRPAVRPLGRRPTRRPAPPGKTAVVPGPRPSIQTTPRGPRTPGPLRKCSRSGRRLTSGRSGAEAAALTGPGPGPSTPCPGRSPGQPRRQRGGAPPERGASFLSALLLLLCSRLEIPALGPWTNHRPDLRCFLKSARRLPRLVTQQGAPRHIAILATETAASHVPAAAHRSLFGARVWSNRIREHPRHIRWVL
ncbi:hypothetical protein NDU88_001635 [Pleurodeles waltl]|uniref:Uncharacterized protein n=1 Tax=Pleurodeles waltl TaxID=8319 RepID=A0AAV7LBK0_PLEWA|nr:hypothetical protein NDU88_001635 [Pleurodeles waltl]